MIYYEIKNDIGKVVISNIKDFSQEYNYRNQKNFSDHIKGIGCKGIYEVVDNISVWLVIEDEDDLLKSSKLLRRTFDFYKKIAIGICKQQREQLSGTRHILPSIHTQMTQEIDLFTQDNPGLFYGESFKASKRNISDFAQDRPDDTARLIVNINKLVLDMGAHLRGIDIIHFGKQYSPEIKSVRVKQAILNQYASFASGFDEAFLSIKVNNIDDDATVMVDKNMFCLVMYNLLSNALKYCMPESEVRFNFSNESKKLDVSMISLRIESDEIQDIFNEGVRGKHAKTSSGSGIGLFVIKNALEKMGKKPMLIEPNYQKNSNLNGEPYVENHFHFDLS